MKIHSIEDIENLFLRDGHVAYAGEGINQLEHALQCAQLAEQAGASPALITAAFLHDICSIPKVTPPRRVALTININLWQAIS
jgi:predicted HD phosphohydrolase